VNFHCPEKRRAEVEVFNLVDVNKDSDLVFDYLAIFERKRAKKNLTPTPLSLFCDLLAVLLRKAAL